MKELGGEKYRQLAGKNQRQSRKSRQSKQSRSHSRLSSGNDIESRGLLKDFEGGEDMQMEKMEKMEKMEEMEKMMEHSSEHSKKESEKKEEPDADICCCTYATNLLVIGVLFVVFGVLIFLNVIGMFLNQYFPWWFPTFSLILFFIYAAGLVMILTWIFNDSKGTRTSLRVAAYLIIGSVVVSVILAIIFVQAACKEHYVMIGTGGKDDSDNYDKQPKAWFILGYVFFGLLIVILALFFVWTVEQYKEKKGDGADEEEEDDKMKMMEKKEKMEKMEKKEKMEKMEKMEKKDKDATKAD